MCLCICIYMLLILYFCSSVHQMWENFSHHIFKNCPVFFSMTLIGNMSWYRSWCLTSSLNQFVFSFVFQVDDFYLSDFKCIRFSFLFSSNDLWTQGLMLARLCSATWTTPPAPFQFSCFSEKVSWCLPRTGLVLWSFHLCMLLMPPSYLRLKICTTIPVLFLEMESH
jgi:hypothetical protein